MSRCDCKSKRTKIKNLKKKSYHKKYLTSDFSFSFGFGAAKHSFQLYLGQYHGWSLDVFYVTTFSWQAHTHYSCTCGLWGYPTTSILNDRFLLLLLFLHIFLRVKHFFLLSSRIILWGFMEFRTANDFGI